MNNKNKVYFHPIFICLSLLLVAPLGMFLLWKSKNYNKKFTICASAVTCVYFMSLVSFITLTNNYDSIKGFSLNDDTDSVSVSIMKPSEVDLDINCDLDSIISLYNKAILDVSGKNIPLPDSTVNFLDKNVNIFPSNTQNDVRKIYALLSESPDYNDLIKNTSLYNNKVISISGTAEKITETIINNQQMSILEVRANEDNKYTILFPGPVGIRKDGNLICLGIPVTNLNNNNLVLIGGKLETVY
ncbi:MAG: hypothetical protein RSB70_05915 [Clostridium sp.]